jgi:membrane associated rhomboid family serine protease
MPFPWPITARGLVILIVIMNLVMGMDNSSTSVATHFGGMIAGFLYMRFYPKVSGGMIGRLRATGMRRKANEPPSKVGKAVDNIFKFKDPDRH